MKSFKSRQVKHVIRLIINRYNLELNDGIYRSTNSILNTDKVEHFIREQDYGWEELEMARTPLRACWYNAALLLCVTVCEGDVSMEVFENWDDYIDDMGKAIEFYKVY